MKLNMSFLKKEIPYSNDYIIKSWQIAGTILVLSLLLGIWTLVLTLVNSDFVLIGVLVCDIRILILNILPIFCVMGMLYYLTNTMWLSFLISGLVSFVIAEVNRFKMVFRDDPFIFEDIMLLSEATEMTGNYKLYLDLVSFFALLFIALTTVYCFFKIRPKVRRSYSRVGGALCAALILMTSCRAFYFNNYDVHAAIWHPAFGTEYKAGNQAMSRGVIYSFVHSIPDAFITPPEGYNAENAKAVIDQYEDVDIPEDKKVHMISIMLEAYNDFSKFEGVEFANDPYKNYHDLEADAYCGDLYTDIFAGSTVFTERQYLTGYSNMNFYKKATPSYIRYFKSQGYEIDAMHPCMGWFYNRKNMNRYLGFDSFDYHENKYGAIPDEELRAPRYHLYISDLDFFGYIIEGYEKAIANNDKYFNFSVTYQNHGPYSTSSYADMDYLLRKDGYTEEEYNTINNYLDGIYKTDIALKELRDYIDAQPEPIVLTLFGDHNPSMGKDNEAYKMLDINLDLDTVEGGQNYYETRYVFYANDAAKKALGKDFVGKGPTISPMFLMNEYFRYVGMEGPAYLNYLTDFRKNFDVFGIVYTGKDEKFTLKRELSVEEQAILAKHRCVEYYVKNSGVSMAE